MATPAPITANTPAKVYELPATQIAPLQPDVSVTIDSQLRASALAMLLDTLTLARPSIKAPEALPQTMVEIIRDHDRYGVRDICAATGMSLDKALALLCRVALAR